MASVTVNLTGYLVFTNYIRWSTDVVLGDAFSASGLSQTLNFADLNEDVPAGRVSLSIVGFNNRFTPEFEATGRIIFEASDGEMLEVSIADADMTETYAWTPTNSAEVAAFVAHVKSLSDNNATLTLTDEDGPPDPPPPPPPATVPSRPDPPALVVNSDTRITATGVAPDDGGSPITSYDWRHRITGSGGSGWVDRSNVQALIQAFSGLVASTEYDFQFRATNNVGDSPRSVIVRATTDATPVTPPPPPPPPPPPRRRTETLWAITATMFGSSVDLTPYVAEATWKHGSKPTESLRAHGRPSGRRPHIAEHRRGVSHLQA